MLLTVWLIMLIAEQGEITVNLEEHTRMETIRAEPEITVGTSPYPFAVPLPWVGTGI